MKKGEQIRYFRKLNKMTQKELGLRLGFNETNAAIRVFQYEAGRRIPKPDTLNRIADIFGVSHHVFEVPDVADDMALLHILFELEDVRGIDIDNYEDNFSFHFDKEKSSNSSLYEHLSQWQLIKKRYQNGEITKAEYDRWRWSY